MRALGFIRGGGRTSCSGAGAWILRDVRGAQHEPEFDVVALPKGGVEPGESALQAAVREIRVDRMTEHAACAG
ncbi:NUDIX domain-containing protein [Deinococcus malanensis]|uniref:NUDIX domain-containing protein n=1 Tax=Deinococcus malanensis TaxID=1706855 RepID=UPI00357152C4